MDSRIGYPNEQLAQDVPDEMASPMYSTGIGLVLEGFSRLSKEKIKESSHGDKKKVKVKKEKKQTSFLKTIQDWFEQDQTD